MQNTNITDLEQRYLFLTALTERCYSMETRETLYSYLSSFKDHRAGLEQVLFLLSRFQREQDLLVAVEQAMAEKGKSE